jgi:hypothetical protein
VYRVADPPAAVHQFKDEIALVTFADWRQHGGQLVAQSPEPAEPVDPVDEIAVPGNQPGASGRGAGSRPGRLAGCRRIVGPLAAWSHEVPPRWRQLVLDSDEDLLALRSFCSSVTSLDISK